MNIPFSVKPRWSPEEDRLLTLAAATKVKATRVVRGGVLVVNWRKLAGDVCAMGLLPHRTLEAHRLRFKQQSLQQAVMAAAVVQEGGELRESEMLDDPVREVTPSAPAEPGSQEPADHQTAAGANMIEADVSTRRADSLREALLRDNVLCIDPADIVPWTPGEHNQRLVDEDLAGWLPDIRPQEGAATNSRGRVAPLPRNPRHRRRALYSRVQKLWRKDRRRCTNDVLSGAWEAERGTATKSEFSQFWGPLMSEASADDVRRPPPVREEQWSAVLEITTTDVKSALAGMKVQTSPGPDGMTLKTVLGLPVALIVARFNLWLLAGCLPTRLCEGYTSFIPKVLGTTNPAEFRPITVGSILSRLYNKIIARRLDSLCPPSSRQKAFRSGDGIAENLALVEQLLRAAQDDRKPRNLFMAFLDVRKAFDSVSHHSLLLAARRAGIPPPLIGYIERYYQVSSTRLKVNGETTDAISVLRGVKQGCPLSGVLFNLVIDWALSSLDDSLGFEIQGVRVNQVAFADDCVPVCSTSQGLKHQVATFVEHLRLSGLTVNAGKCKTLAIRCNGKTRKWVCDPNSFLKIDGGDVPALSIADAYKYLGIQVKATGSLSAAEAKLKDKLRMVARAPLKPQQRLFVLRNNVLPALQHDLVLSRVTKGLLASLDRIVRRSVRAWLKLPHDTAIPFFYARVEDGGLGITCLEYTLPELKVNRYTKLLSMPDPVTSAFTSSEPFQRKISRLCDARHRTWRGRNMSTRALRNEAFASELYSSVDGRGLESANLVPEVHSWVVNGCSLLSGHNFCAAIGVRAATLPTKLRGARGRQANERECGCGRTRREDGSRVLESLGHILQECFYTHGATIKRHNRLLTLIVGILERRGYTCNQEPVYHIAGGARRRPDLLFWKQNESFILDVTVVSDMTQPLDKAHWQKVEYYGRYPEIVAQTVAVTGNAPELSAFAVNWRGCVAPSSASFLRARGFTKADLVLLSAVCVEQGARIHRVHWQSRG